MIVNRKRLFFYCVGIFSLYVVVDISGVFRHPLERDYYTEFSYPLEVENFPEVVRKFREGQDVPQTPINRRYESLKFINNSTSGCGVQDEPLRLLVLVKSALKHFRNREVIRSTWGARRFSDVPIKTVFLFGLQEDEKETVIKDGETMLLKDLIEDENKKYGDIVRADFIDSYYNNTLKTMMGMRWAAEKCSNFKFIFFVDDDMYVSVKNLLKFVRHPTEYPEYWELAKLKKPVSFRIYPDSVKNDAENYSKNLHSGDQKTELRKKKPWKNDPSDFDIELHPEAKLYAGYVFFVPPHRHKIGTKWFLPLEEYPFNYFPPYVPAGAIVMSKAAFQDIYYASFFTQHFRFDDIFVALCAKKMGIEPFHSDYFRFWAQSTRNPNEKDYKYVITEHGFNNPEELLQFWNAQRTLGNA